MQSKSEKPLSKRQQRLLEKQQNQPKIPFEEYKKQVQAMPNMNPFKYMEKIYKLHHNVDTDFSECIDFSNKNLDLEKNKIKKLKIKEHTVYELQSPQGVYIIKDCISIKDQLDIAKNCMNKYIHEPYRQKKQSEENKEQDKSDTVSMMSQNTAKDYNKDHFVINDYQKFNFDTKIRWANVGSQYDWDNRQYPLVQTPMPQQIYDLQNLCTDIFKEKVEDIEKYEAQSVIINFYHKKSYMTGHLDDGEPEQRKPIFSFSFGESCVFLMGDKEKDVQPLPIILEAGDLMVMSGYSRNCYHGVPRIIEGSFKKEKYLNYLKENHPDIFEGREKNKDEKDFENDYLHVINFLSQSRINFNFRQVLKKDGEKNEEQKE
ncbi:hypothetical protein PPERSA_02199 [Pseudocohnilembus persalinus]|uniref:Fe2OG dioxygenase domain-containing protein n=1 Tax=Pseudocohnilembus persalinus TaxID=266149 RepID=A0A0V0R0P7_PSEPJ|nr:hypothetical protein PPERSA_02199 [Pseudocohnilembus persalinus]|eukprot:KRX08067.1 hypothetical protein PPERSA_02199 [Pseudocohnilembus persalinus]